MILIEKYKEIYNVLLPYSDIWGQEVLNFYPHNLKNYPSSWIESLKILTIEELHKVDAHLDYSSLKGGPLYDLFFKLENTAPIEKKAIAEDSLPSFSWNHIKRKKRHEIIQIMSELKVHPKKFKTIYDIGSGVGHLSRMLSYFHGVDSYSIDMNLHFQEIGKKYLKSLQRPKNAGIVKFIHLKFDGKTTTLLPDPTQEDLLIGLHTCGPLAVECLKIASQKKIGALLNFGCCYAKLDPQTDCNLWAKKHEKELPYTIHGLTLATRGHMKTSFEDFLTKKRVKFYRYSLHLLLYHEYGITKFQGVGECQLKTYSGPFHEYALLKLKELKLPPMTKEKLHAFHFSPQHQELLKHMFLTNIIRWQFGRLIEKAIILDRALYLQENGFNVEVAQYFTSSISPRNLGILAYQYD